MHRIDVARVVHVTAKRRTFCLLDRHAPWTVRVKYTDVYADEDLLYDDSLLVLTQLAKQLFVGVVLGGRFESVCTITVRVASEEAAIAEVAAITHKQRAMRLAARAALEQLK